MTERSEGVVAKRPKFLAELRRRNVIRMAGLYLVGAWLLVQVAETVLPAFDIPSWVLRAIIIVLALGFVPALVFSWVFELTPGGLKRDAEVPIEQSIAPQTARRLDRLIIVVLLLALTYFGFAIRFEQVHVGSHDLFDLKARIAIHAGRPWEARALLEQLRQRSSSGGVVDYLIAQLHALLGEHGAAAQALERAYRRRDPSLAADDLFYLPEDWPDHPGIRAALDKPEWNALFAIRRAHFAKTPRQKLP